MRRSLLVLMFLFLGVATKPAHAQPTWCKVDGLGSDSNHRANSDVRRALDKDWTTAFEGIIKNTCNPDEEAKGRMKEVNAARAAWAKKLGMIEDDWRDLAEWFVKTNGLIRLYKTDFKVGTDYDKKYAWTTLTPVQQFAAITNGIPNGPSSSNYADWNYLTDALGTKLSETGRLAYIYRCADQNVLDEPVLLAMCEADIKVLDRKKVLDEVRADKAHGRDKMMIRVMLWQLDELLAKYNEAVKKWKDKDPAYGKMFETAAKVRQEWEGIWKTDTALLDLALEMDDARQTSSRKALEGCSDKTWAAWRAAVAKIPAKKFEGFSTDIADSWMAPAMAVVTNYPQAYLASVALFSCHKADAEKDPVLSSLGAAMSYVPGMRGPRLATHWAIQSSGLQLDDASAKIDYPSARHDSGNRFIGSSARGYFGTVAKVGKPDAKGMAVVTYNKKTQKQEQCLNSRYTKRISQITSNGTVIYESECLKWGVVTLDKTPEPQTVHKRYLDGLKPGMNAYIGSGAVMAAFPKGKKTPTAVAGVIVK